MDGCCSIEFACKRLSWVLHTILSTSVTWLVQFLAQKDTSGHFDYFELIWSKINFWPNVIYLHVTATYVTTHTVEPLIRDTPRDTPRRRHLQRTLKLRLQMFPPLKLRVLTSGESSLQDNLRKWSWLAPTCPLYFTQSSALPYLAPPWKVMSRWPTLREHPTAERVGWPAVSFPRVTVTDRDTLLTDISQLPESLIWGLQKMTMEMRELNAITKCKNKM